jgi:alkylation response protein AidB-like acyl-CoA dehydrogenase
MTTAVRQLLPDSVLEEFRLRAPEYDRENRFSQEDFDALVAHDFLKMPIPEELGGLGMTLSENLQRNAKARHVRPADGRRHQHASLLDGGCRRHVAGW